MNNSYYIILWKNRIISVKLQILFSILWIEYLHSLWRMRIAVLTHQNIATGEASLATTFIVYLLQVDVERILKAAFKKSKCTYYLRKIPRVGTTSVTSYSQTFADLRKQGRKWRYDIYRYFSNLDSSPRINTSSWCLYHCILVLYKISSYFDSFSGIVIALKWWAAVRSSMLARRSTDWIFRNFKSAPQVP